MTAWRSSDSDRAETPFEDTTVQALLQTAALTLATVGAGGRPHAAPVYFAPDERLRLYFFSSPDSQHSLDLRDDPRAAAALYPATDTWQDIRGLQLRGEVRAVPSGPEWEAAWAHYAGKFPFVRELEEAVLQTQMYVFIPEWVRLVDNRQGFGFKREWALR